MKNIIYIYNDYGISQTSCDAIKTSLLKMTPSNQIRPINAEQIIKGAWRETARLFIMPGGVDLHYCHMLNGAGNRQIKAYVTEGGIYIGICAGAYYGTAYCDFAYTVNKNPQNTVIETRELAFYPGGSVGPYLAPYEYNSENGARIAKILYKRKIHHVYFNGGCYFEAPERFPNTTVLARYNNEGFAQHAAIIKCTVGNGKALLSGVHPEIDIALLV